MKMLIMLIVGVAAGGLAGLFGVGGGVILVPMLMLVLGYSQVAANGTSLVALLLPVGFFAVMEYYKAGKISIEHIRYGLLISVGMFAGAYFGSKLAVSLDPILMKRSFSIFLVIVALRFWLQT